MATVPTAPAVVPNAQPLMHEAPHDRLAGLADAMLADDDPANDEQKQEAPEGQGEIEQVEQPEQGEPDAEAAEELEETEFEGKMYKVPHEIRRALLREADYTRKTQEVATERKAIERDRQIVAQTAQLAQEFAPIYGHINGLVSQINSLQQVNIAQLEADDPIKAQSIRLQYLGLNQELQQAQSYLAQKQQEYNRSQETLTSQRRNDAIKQVREKIKDWGPQRDQALASFATKNGLNEVDMDVIASDSRYVVLLDKAMRWDELQAKSRQLSGKVKTLPPVATGSARALQPEHKAQEERLRKQIKSTGGTDSDDRRALLAHRLNRR